MTNIKRDETKCLTYNRHKEPFNGGMVFRSKTHPYMDCIIEYAFYGDKPTSYSSMSWYRINYPAFDKFLAEKGIHGSNTFPYSSGGCCSHQNMKQLLKKYNLVLEDIEEHQVISDEYDAYYSKWTEAIHQKYSKLLGWDKPRR